MALPISIISIFLVNSALTAICGMWHPRKRTVSCGMAFSSSSSRNALGMTVLNRYGPTHYSQVSRYFSGTLYAPSVVAETSPSYTYLNKRDRLIKAFARLNNSALKHSITTQSCTSLASVPNDSIDYAFVDPPFGRNLQYSELNQIWEAWLRVKTNRTPEAVMDATRQREIPQYTDLMRNAFCELFRVLKPGRWLTVVFHNASNSVWFAIQESLMSAGFVIADVRTLDRESDTYKQSRQGLVKQDLVISTYKPSKEFEERFRVESSTEQGAWQFVEMHLSHIPVAVTRGNKLEVIPERQNYLLFDRMVAFHVQRGIGVPLSASEFFKGLKQGYPERDDMYFLPSQVSEYEQKRMQANVLEQPELFVSDEKSAIQWVRRQLSGQPATYQDLQPTLHEGSATGMGETRAANRAADASLSRTSSRTRKVCGVLPTRRRKPIWSSFAIGR